MDPRGFTIYPTNPPTEEGCLRPFLWRLWIKTPERGRIAIFDRSWYGRVLVERVEHLCTEAEWRRAYREINEMEGHLALVCHRVEFEMVCADQGIENCSAEP